MAHKRESRICQVTGREFLIEPEDFEFCERVARRNPMKLWERTTEDRVKVMTSFAPDRPEKIYSKEAYKKLFV
ncbi:MAG: hypothetical protein HY978_00615 [Candidatus Liptonbacteria bacterium]|nr:hypothetical protein [Candidatus Liptonbacteria bacterium]